MQTFTVYMPRVESRKHWAEISRAGGRAQLALGPPLTFCSSCSVGIGQLYWQRELYLLPTVRIRKRRPPELRWQHLCGLCALEDYRLAFGYCLVSEQDWESHPVFDLSYVEAAKSQQLADYLLHEWPSEDGVDLTAYIQRLSPPASTVQDLDTVLAA